MVRRMGIIDHIGALTFAPGATDLERLEVLIGAVASFKG